MLEALAPTQLAPVGPPMGARAVAVPAPPAPEAASLMRAPAACDRRARGALLVLAAGLLGFSPIAGRAGAASRDVLAASSDTGLEITATASGFEPKVVRLRKGESVRLVLRTTEREQCFAVDELRVEKRILPGRDTLVDLTPDKIGSFAFYSCLEPDNPALRGRLIVSE